jgi:predicted ester cyclase
MLDSVAETNRKAATRFIEVFNTNAWEVLPEVVAPGFVLHHPMGGTMQLGPDGMKEVWSHFKAALPDAWHPIPVMITDGDYLANLLPTYGNFTGNPHQGIPPTGEWLEYGMVNLVRLVDGKITEGWFGMDPVVELQQMGAAPQHPPRPLTDREQANLALYQETVNMSGRELDNLTAFGDVLVAMGPPQHGAGVTNRRIDIFDAASGTLELVYSHELMVDPPYGGDESVDTESSRVVVKRFLQDVLVGHRTDILDDLASPHVLIHPTAMPCEAAYYGLRGLNQWLGEQWSSFPDLAVTDHFEIARGDIVVVRWTARGTSRGAFLMLPPTGSEVEYTGVSMFRIEGGKIAEIWDTRNTLGIMMQLNPDMARGHAH